MHPLKWVTLSYCFLLASCSLPGTFFLPQAAGSEVRVGRTSFSPRLIPITPSLYAYSQAAPKGSVWLKNLWYKKNYAYLIGPADVLSITVWDHPELSSPVELTNRVSVNPGMKNALTNDAPGFLVSAKGNLFFPYAGKVHAQGLTVNQLRQKLQIKLRRYIKFPQVNIRLTGFRSQTVQVIGAVHRQGTVSISDKPLTILDAIAQSEGIDTTTADTSHIFIVRGSVLKPQVFVLNAKNPSSLLIAQHFKLYAGDIIYIPDSSLSNWNRFVSQILPSLQTIAYTRTLYR